MPIKFLTSALVIFSMFACGGSQADTTGQAKPQGSKGTLEFKVQSGKAIKIVAERDTSVSPKSKPRKIKVIGEIPNIAVIVVDTYPSIPGGMSYCQAGEESFLRVISLTHKNPIETFFSKLESCRDNIELASPGIEWKSAESTLVVNWLQGPSIQGKTETLTLVIDQDGKPK